MKKLLTLIAVLLLVAGQAYALEIMSDASLEEISAGELSLTDDIGLGDLGGLSTLPTGINKQVDIGAQLLNVTEVVVTENAAGDIVDIREIIVPEVAYVVNNTMTLVEDAQKSITAESNANAVDSALAVQTNAASISGDAAGQVTAADITQSNEAQAVHYRPMNTASAGFSIDADYSYKDSNETKTAADGTEVGAKQTYASNDSSADITITSSETIDILVGQTMEAEECCATNNHLLIAQNVQEDITVLSNLNVVGAAASVQNNFISNINVSGTITQSNVALVRGGVGSQFVNTNPYNN
jgi:hypothetical protein